jgi:hypothetical protein
VSSSTTAPPPAYNPVAIGDSPSVAVPWGWHSENGPFVCFCYDARWRTVAYRLANRRHNMTPDQDSGGTPWLREVWEGVGVAQNFVGAKQVIDDWAAMSGVSEWLAVRTVSGSLAEEPAVLEALEESGGSHPAEFGAALRGGVVLAKKWVGGWSFTTLPSDVVRTIADHSLVVTRAEELLGANPFGWAAGGSFTPGDQLYLMDMAADAADKLRKGDLEGAGKAGDVYWTYAAACAKTTSPHADYMKARVAGALGGFPLDAEANTLFLLTPPEKRERVMAMLPGWRELPFRVTPWGARLAGVF